MEILIVMISMVKLSIWIQASRPPAYINLGLPLLLGQAMAWYQTHLFEPVFFWLIMVYGWFMQLYIVFLNDYADRVADMANTHFTLFSGGSRVLPQRRLSPQVLRRAGITAGALVLVLGIVLTLFFNRPLCLVLFPSGLGLLWAYSLPPIQLNYRGGGELLQGAGCGFLLPLAGYYIQVGHFNTFPWLLLIPHGIFHIVSSIATALPDWSADRCSGKKTWAAIKGVDKAAWTMILLGVVSISSNVFIFPPFTLLQWGLVFALPIALLVLCIILLPQLQVCRTSIVVCTAAVLSIVISYTTGLCLALVYG